MKPLDRCHPDDERLIALYFGDQQAEAEERRAVRQHLHGCEACTWRYTELIAPLERLKQDAASEADEVFTPARLEAQRGRIMRSLDEDARAARVVRFPASAAVLDRAVIRRPAMRWIAAAAAAGLFIGAIAGRFADFSGMPARQADRAAVQQGVAGPRDPLPALAVQDGRPADEAFLTEVDRAATRQRIAELAALDEMTPHVTEAVLTHAGR